MIRHASAFDAAFEAAATDRALRHARGPGRRIVLHTAMTAALVAFAIALVGSLLMRTPGATAIAKSGSSAPISIDDLHRSVDIKALPVQVIDNPV